MEERPYQTIVVGTADHITTITLNIPERKNPIGPAMVNELLWALDDAANDENVRVIVLTGAGKAFSAGGDLKQLSGGLGGHGNRSIQPGIVGLTQILELVVLLKWNREAPATHQHILLEAQDPLRVDVALAPNLQERC